MEFVKCRPVARGTPPCNPAFPLLDQNQEAELVTHFRHAAIVAHCRRKRANREPVGSRAVATTELLQLTPVQRCPSY
jgi:hypothetical protein